MQVLLCESPRAIYLLADDAAKSPINAGKTALRLSTQSVPSTSSSTTSSLRAIIETVRVSDLPPLNTLERLQVKAYGCLGLLNVGSDLFVAVITSASQMGHIRPGEAVLRVHAVSFYCLNKALWDESLISDDRIDTTAQYEQDPNSTLEHPCTGIRKLMSNGTFYFAKNGSFDLSRRLQRRMKGKRSSPTNSAIAPPSTWDFDSRYVWNSYLMDPIVEHRDRLDMEERRALDAEGFFIPAIQGYVGVEADPYEGHSVALVSRLSWKRAGTRYNTRGINDDGHVANFAESETIVCYHEETISYCQIRGSVPLFWEQQGLQAFNARIQVTRPRVASQPAFDRHFSDLLLQYEAVHALNLLGTRDAETILSASYADHIRNSDAEQVYRSSLSKLDMEQSDHDDIDRIGLTNFDFHTATRQAGGIDGAKTDLKRLAAVQNKLKAFGMTLILGDDALMESQRGVFRTNCLDCLDRTNVVQDILSQMALELQFTKQPELSSLRDPSHPIWLHHRTLWAENGDALSKLYAGTGALNTSYTRAGGGKKTLGGLLSDAAKSASRMYINNFQDKSKQNVIDALLGNMANQAPVSVYDPLHDAVNAELSERMDEYSSKKQVHIYTGTWNLAGCSPSGESLSPLLFPEGVADADVYAIGLQEVVPLNAQQILMTDTDKIKAWEYEISETFSKQSNKDNKGRFTILRSEQLVGTALIVLVKESLIPYVRLVEASTKKTGLKGMSGNKGGVSVRMNIYDTSFCFVTAHLAAGKSNVEERNADYLTISRNLHFNSGRGIDNSNYCFWFGDFNYRLDGGNEVVRPLCDAKDYDSLILRDQLCRAKSSHQAFVGYTEGALKFLPTYKYDYRSQNYDSSEKLRVPAWTDRVLFRSQYPFEVDQLCYDRAELMVSDHRPVYARFVCEARVFDSGKRNALRRELLTKYKKEQAGTGGIKTGILIQQSSDDEDVSGVSGTDSDLSDAESYTIDGLPDPSGLDSNWWDSAIAGDKDKEDLSDDHLDMNANPFLKRNGVDEKVPSSSNSTKGQDAPSSAAGKRRPPPPPPLIPATPTNVSAITGPSPKAPAQNVASAPRPPPVPKKPVIRTPIDGSTEKSQPDFMP